MSAGNEAVSNRAQIAWSFETAFNEVIPTAPAPTMVAVPFTGESLKHQKQTDASQRIRNDRNVEALVEVGRSAQGDINVEMQADNFDAWLAAAFMDTLRTATLASQPVNAVASTNKVTLTTGTWNATVRGARFVKITGFTNPLNNGIKRVASNTTTELTLEAGSIVADQSGASIGLSVAYLRNGVTQKSMLIEKQFLDVGEFITYRGMTINQFAMAIQAKQRITGVFSFMGSKGVESNATAALAVTQPSTRPILRAGANVAGLYIDGAQISAGVKKVDFSIANNLRGKDECRQLETRAQGLGDCDVKVNLETYLEDRQLIGKFYSHTAVEFAARLVDDQGNLFGIHCPVLQFTEGDAPIGGRNQDVMLPLNGTATVGTSTLDGSQYTTQIDILRLVP